MKVHRILVIVLALLAVATLAPAAAARPDQEAGSLELQEGEGTVVLAFARGAVYGQIDRGRLTITSRRGDEAEVEVVVNGQESASQRDDRTTVYRGRDIRFKVAGPGWRVGIQGVGIDASIVGRGVVTIRGEAGSLSLDGGPFRPWPFDFRPLVLGG